MSWRETYRGTVYRWEVDNVDHFTVAYYFERIEDATLALLPALGLDQEALDGAGLTCATLDCHVRYLRELKVGDIVHVRSGVIDVASDGLLLGHQIFDSGDETLCTSVAQRIAAVSTRDRAPVPLSSRQAKAAESCRVEWNEPRQTVAVPSTSEARFFESARDTIKPREVDTLGRAAFPAYIHRFSAANGHVLATFGMTPAYMRTEGRGFSTFEFRLRFPGSLRAGELVQVRSSILHVGASSMRFFHAMTNARTGEEVATLEQSGVHLDLAARRSTPLPDHLRERAKDLLPASNAGVR
jgi:acyl-CoA thioesterase FadM